MLLLSGPTACGKTTLSLLLARALGGEIVSADSVQVYRGMDIGTAKVSREERERVPHHLIDIRDVDQEFNIVDFYYEARLACASILARGRVPIVVGGSGFYLRTLLYGPPSGPPSVPEVRRALEEEIRLNGAALLYERLRTLDPTYAATINARDRHKIVRALEIIEITGGKVSALTPQKGGIVAEYDCRAWFLTRPRGILYQRIDARCEEMLQAGLVEEVERLREALKENPAASQAIGYRQALHYLETGRTAEDYQRFVVEFKQRSRHYAKKQCTWFRNEPLFHWINIEIHDFELVMESIIRNFQM